MMRILSVIGALFLGGAFLTSCTTSGRVSTFVVLPDTQTYLEQCPEVFDSQVDWLVANRKKIDAVFQVGDLTQDNSPVEWAYMQKAFYRISQAGIPYSVVWGNHDIGSKPGKFSDVHNTAMANKYFPLSDYMQKNYWGGSADGKTLDNYYINFRSGDTDWMVLNLEFGPSDEALQWADSIVGIHPDKLVILNTHAYLYCDSTLHDGKDWWRPQGYGIGKESGRTVNDGAGIWEKLLLKHRNVIAVFCGHVLKSGVDINPFFTLYIDLSRVFPFWINKLCYLDKIYISVIPTYLSYRIKRNERSVWGVILNLLIGSLHLLLWHSGYCRVTDRSAIIRQYYPFGLIYL